MNNWSTAIACAVCQALGAALITVYGFYVADITQTFALTYAQANMGVPILFLTIALVAPTLGKLVDRVAIKPLLILGVSLAMVGIYAVSTANSVAVLISGFVLFSFGVALYGPLVSNALLVKQYRSNRARALAIAAMGTSIASIALPLVVGGLLLRMDWRESLIVLAGSIWLIVLVSVLLGVREQNRSQNHDATPGERTTGRDTRLFRRREFWLIGVGFAVIFNISTLNAFCLIPHLQSMAFPAGRLPVIMAIGGIFGFAGKLGFAIVSDRLAAHLKVTLVVLAASQVIGWLMLGLLSSNIVPYVAMALLGSTAGICLPLQPFVNSLYFGDKAIGAVIGAQTPLMLPLGITTPFLAGMIFDTTGSYQIAFLAAAVMALLVGVLFMLLPAAADRHGN